MDRMSKDNGEDRGLRGQPLTQYLGDISALPLLTREEEIALARRIQQGERAALHKLVEANLRFVVSVAAKYSHSSIPLSDLSQEGNIGLIKAAERFNHDRGVKFITYAIWWVEASIKCALAKQAGVIGLPLKHPSTVSKIIRKEEELSQQLGRDPARDEVAEALGLSPQDIAVNLMAARTPLFLDASIPDDPSVSYHGTLKADFQVDEGLVAESLREELESLLRVLDERERDVISMRFGLNGYEPMTLREAGRMLGLSRERIRQIEGEGLEQLQQVAKARGLEEFIR
ncbi:MAG: RNA polymerase sigma factor RpoD/SigA, partial [Nitrospinota bacterium]